MKKFPKATIAATEVHLLKSLSNKLDYRISVALPYSYPDELEKEYPVVYLLDPNWAFGLVTEMTRFMSVGGFPESIIVGIGYPFDEPLEENFADLLTLRSIDYTPTEDTDFSKMIKDWVNRDVELGGASQFLGFLEDQLLPMIDAQYRTMHKDRSLLGHSLGGLFTLYTLFHKPRLFQKYIAASPSLLFGFVDLMINVYEKNFARKRKTLPASLYLGAGSLEHFEDGSIRDQVVKFKKILEKRNYKGLEVTMKIFEGYGHFDVVAPIYQAGLKELFS